MGRWFGRKSAPADARPFVRRTCCCIGNAYVQLIAAGSAAAGAYRYWVDLVAPGSFRIAIENRSASTLAEALVFNFAVLKAAGS